MSHTEPDTVPAEAVKIMTFNIRYGTARDGENSWSNRREQVFHTIRSEAPDFACLQEAVRFQITETDSALAAYKHIGRTREADDKGEATPIFYNATHWSCQDSGTFWLSETPQVEASISWQAQLPRIATWGKFEHRSSGREIFVYNTHFSHVSEEARMKSAALIASHIAAHTGNIPTVLAGDFNAAEESAAIRTLKQSLVDTYRQVNRSAPGETYFGWEPHILGTGRRIDYIFAKPTATVLDARVLEESINGRYPSDHNPVVVELAF